MVWKKFNEMKPENEKSRYKNYLDLRSKEEPQRITPLVPKFFAF